MPTNNYSVSTTLSNFLTRTGKNKGIWKPTYFGETNIHNYIVSATYSSQSWKRMGSRFPTPLLCASSSTPGMLTVSIHQILAIKRFGKNDVFSTRTTQKLGKNPCTEIQNSLEFKLINDLLHTNVTRQWSLARRVRCPLSPPLSWSLREAKGPGKLCVLQIPAGPLAPREYSIRMLPCSCCA